MHVTPAAATSTATARVRPTMPAFAAAYDDWSGMALTGPVVDATLTIRPKPRATIPGRNARVTRNAVSRLRARSARQSSADNAVSGS